LVTADEVRTARFREQLRGYNPDDVDRLLERAAKELDAGQSPGAIVKGAVFRKKFRGYRMADVDELLAKLGSP
jgi:DivIVA domain-containing protein